MFIVEGRQDAEQFSGPAVLEHLFQGLHHLCQPIARHELGGGGDEHQIGGEDGALLNTSHTRRRVHQNEIIFSAQWSKQSADGVHPTVLGIDHDLRRGRGAVTGDDLEVLSAGGPDPLVNIEGGIHQQIERAGLLGESECHGALSLRIEIHDQAASFALRQQSGEREGGGGFSGSTFLIGNGYGFQHGILQCSIQELDLR